jgi:hypothetical protein
MTTRFLTRREAAELLGVSTDCIAAWEYKARKSGRPEDAPPSLLVGKLRRYPEQALLGWVVTRSREAERRLRGRHTAKAPKSRRLRVVSGGGATK